MVRGLPWAPRDHWQHRVQPGLRPIRRPERATKDIDLVVLADAFDDGYYHGFVEFDITVMCVSSVHL